MSSDNVGPTMIALLLLTSGVVHAGPMVVLTSVDMDGISAGGSNALTSAATSSGPSSGDVSSSSDGGATAVAYSQGEITVVTTDAQGNDRFAAAKSFSFSLSPPHTGFQFFY